MRKTCGRSPTPEEQVGEVGSEDSRGRIVYNHRLWSEYYKCLSDMSSVFDRQPEEPAIFNNSSHNAEEGAVWRVLRRYERFVKRMTTTTQSSHCNLF